MTEKKTAYLGTAGYVPNPNRYGSAELLKAVGANTGNLLFQYASTELIGDKREHVGYSGKSYGDADVFRKLDYFVFPAANHLRVDGDWDLLVGFLKTIKVPLVVLGLGAQADRGDDPKSTAAQLRDNRSVMTFVSLLRERARLVTVRGTFSEAVCHELGLGEVVRMGCPSQFINPERFLGAKIQAQLANLRECAGSARVAMTASAPNELHGWRSELEEKLFAWTNASSGLYVQQSCESWFFDEPEGFLADLTPQQIRDARRRIAPSMDHRAFTDALRKTFRIYFDVRRWIEDLSTVDFAIGTRIHGNMAALAAGRPGILVVHDARVTELAHEMHVPWVGGDAVIKADDFREVLQAVQFDGASFDNSRRRNAALLVEAFRKLGLPASDHLKALAA